MPISMSSGYQPHPAVEGPSPGQNGGVLFFQSPNLGLQLMVPQALSGIKPKDFTPQLQPFGNSHHCHT